MDSETRGYFERRAEEERIAAECAVDGRAVQAHRMLAGHYRSLAEGRSGPKPDEAPIANAGTVSSDFRILP